MEGQKVPPLLLRKICHIYLTMMKLATVTTYLKKIQKVYESRDIPLAFHWHQQFSTEISKVCYIKKYRYRLHFDIWFLILLNFLECLKIFLINMVTILTMSARMSTLAILRLEESDFFSQWTREMRGKMKIRIEKPAVNISNLTGGKNKKARRRTLHEKLRLDL